MLQAIVILTLLATVLEASAPGWWNWNYGYWYYRNGSYWNLKNLAAPADDYAVANVGQLKNFAAAAAVQMNYTLQNQGGAGTEISALLDSWNTPDPKRDDYAALTAGEAKTVAKKFYDRLAGLYAWTAGSQPWPATPTAATDDYAVINIGQLKNLFSFEILNPDYDLDSDGMSNGFEIRYGLDFRTANGQDDADSDGMTNLMEFWLDLNPAATDSNGNGVADGMEDSDLDGVSNSAELAVGTDPADSLNGDNFYEWNINYDAGRQLVLSAGRSEVPFKFQITSDTWNESLQDYDPRVNLPVIFEVVDGPGTLENEAGTNAGTKLIAFTDSDGYVSMYFRGASLKSTSKVRVSLIRLRPDLYAYPTDFTLWTSQCAVDLDDDGMDDLWEQAIVTASAGLIASIAEVLPTDDFDRDGVPNVFEFDRGTDPTEPADLPEADIILDHTNTAYGTVPVAQTWVDAVEAAAVATSYDEHPEIRRIMKIMPGTYETSNNGNNPYISRSMFLWGQGSVIDGAVILTNSNSYAAIIQANYNSIRHGVFMASGILLNGSGREGLLVQGSYQDPDSADSRPWVHLSDCFVHQCKSYALDFSNVRASLDFITITDCGSDSDYSGQDGNAVNLYYSSLELRNSILWNVNTSAEMRITPSDGTSGTGLASVLRSDIRNGTTDFATHPDISQILSVEPQLAFNGMPTYASPVRGIGDMTSILSKTSGYDAFHQDRFAGAGYADLGAVAFVDSDGDRLPDALEGGTDLDPLGDPDNDTIGTLAEYETYYTNPFDPDTDHDGVPDDMEIYWLHDPNVSDDYSADVDEDGLTAAQELALGTSLVLNDTDGDGTPDGQDDFPLDPLLQTKAAGGTPPVIVLESPSQAQLVP